MNKSTFDLMLRLVGILCLFGLTGGGAHAQYAVIVRDTTDGAIAFNFDDNADVLTSNASTPSQTLSLAALGVNQACQFRVTLSGRVPSQTLVPLSKKTFVVVATVMGPKAQQKNTIPFIIPASLPSEQVRTVLVAFTSQERTVEFDNTPGPTSLTLGLRLHDIVRLQQLIDDPSIGPGNLRIGIRMKTEPGGFTLDNFTVRFSSALGALVSANTIPGGLVNVTARITNTGQISQSPVEFLSSLPAQLEAVPGSCTATVDNVSIGACAIKRATIWFTIPPFDPDSCGSNQTSCPGSLEPGKTVVVSYQARISNHAPSCAKLCLGSTTSHSCQSVRTCVTTNCPPQPVCVRGQGFWKTHSEAWPVRSLMLGNEIYSQVELLNLLGMPTRGDASLILARQLIAAKLNIANGAGDHAIAAAVAGADRLLSTFAGKLPYGIKTSTVRGQAAVNLANILERYNEGYLAGGPPSCR